MRSIVVSKTGAGTSNVVPLDTYRAAFEVSIGCAVSGTVNYKIQHTYDDPFAATFSAASATWFDHPTITGKTANADGSYTAPVKAVRINIASGSGSVTATIVQTGSPGV